MIAAAQQDPMPASRPFPSLARALGAIVFVYVCWLGVLALHEFGHVLNTWVSGGRVVAVLFPPLGFSQTIVEPNRAARFVAWGGMHWGCAIPLTACGLALAFRRCVPEPLKFFTGFCLIVNGVYLALGWLSRGNDSADLLREGVSRISLVGVGIAATVFGLAIWHQLKWLTLAALAGARRSG